MTFNQLTTKNLQTLCKKESGSYKILEGNKIHDIFMDLLFKESVSYDV
jgi:hypothetical protein